MPIRSMTYPLVPAHQADAVLSQANPVSGTKYTVLATAYNVRLIELVAIVTFTVQPNPLEIHETIDGVALVWAQGNPASATGYFATSIGGASSTGGGFATAATHSSRAFLHEGRTVKIEAETTGGTVQNLDGRVKYAKW